MISRTLLLVALAIAQDQPRSPFTTDGVQGGGHACNSGLRVHQHTLDYDTSFTDCPNTPYTVIEHSGDHYVYRLRPTRKSCPLHVLTIDRPEDMQEAWLVVGYSSEVAWRRKDSKNSIDCLMY